MKSIRLDRNEKIALARIVGDLIEADFIVEENEMAFYERTISGDGYNISKAMLAEAKRMSFAKAVGLMKSLDAERRQTVMATLKGLALSDGSCAPLEAIQMFALEQAIEHDAKVFSIPAANNGIENLKVIYIENSDNTTTGKRIKDNYTRICNDFAMVGMDFVFVPQVVEDYRKMEPAYLEKVVRYMIPMVSDEKIRSICDELRNTTTTRFCRNLLYKKLGIPLSDAEPSLLIKINVSNVVDSYSGDDTKRTAYANFLLIRLGGGNICGEIERLTESYRSMVDGEIVVRSKPVSHKFKYFGFHRSLFDLIAYGKERDEYRMVLDLRNGSRGIRLVATDDESKCVELRMRPQETALLYLIARKSSEGGGLDWRSLPTGSAQQTAAQEEYNRVYRLFSNGRESADYKDRTQIHRIKRRIESLGELANADMFVPRHTREGNKSLYTISAPPEFLVFLD